MYNLITSLKRVAPLAAAAILLASCGKKEYKPMNMSDLGKSAFDGEDAEITGTVLMQASVITYAGGREQFWLAGEVKGQGVKVYIDPGTEPNQMRPLPSEYTEEDFEITDMHGEKIHLLDKAKVRGELSDGDGWTHLVVDEIEKVK